MSFEFGPGKRWLSAIAVVVCIAVLLWKSNVLTTSSSIATPASEKKVEAPVNKQTEGEVSRVPVLLPGETCVRASEVLGKPTEKDKFGGTWEKQDLKAFIAVNSKCVITGIDVEIKPAHHAMTSDGIILGLNTVTDAERILKSRVSKDSESVEGPEGIWEAKITLEPVPGFPYRADYIATLKPEVVNQLNRDPVFDDFRGLVVSDYSLEMVAPSE